MLDGAGRFVEVLNSQRADVSKAIAIADEYLGAVAAAKGGLHQLIDQINLLETMLIDKRVEVREAVRTLTRFINRIAALQPAWATTFEPMGRQLAAAIDELDNIGERLTGLIDGVHAVAGRFGALVLPDGTVAVDQSGMSAPPAPGVDPAALLERVCIPIPGKAC
jgi:phospholipid/cholesterol/gamma-HCH transport system substrate-binding protein